MLGGGGGLGQCLKGSVMITCRDRLPRRACIEALTSYPTGKIENSIEVFFSFRITTVRSLIGPQLVIPSSFITWSSI